MAAYTLDVDSADSLNKTTTTTTVDSASIRSTSDGQRSWQIDVTAWDTDMWITYVGYGSNDVTKCPDPVALADGAHKVQASKTFTLFVKQARWVIVKLLSTGASASYSIEPQAEMPEVNS